MKLPKGHTATVTQNYFFFGPSHSVAWEGLLRPWIRLLLQSHTEKGFIILPIISVGAETKLARRRHTKLSYYAYCNIIFSMYSCTVRIVTIFGPGRSVNTYEWHTNRMVDYLPLQSLPHEVRWNVKLPGGFFSLVLRAVAR